MMWNVAIAQYHKSGDAVAERRIASGLTSEEAEKFINDRADRPIYAYPVLDPNSSAWDALPLLTIETAAYRAEHCKVKAD